MLKIVIHVAGVSVVVGPGVSGEGVVDVEPWVSVVVVEGVVTQERGTKQQ